MANVKGRPIGSDSGWTEVVRRKKNRVQEGGGRVDVASSAWKVPYENTCSFYFSEFPDSHGTKEMLRAFKLYGDALEVVIPSKRDKWGKRFGFVRFTNVDDSRMFAIKLDNIIFGSTKIHVNVPRFQRESNVREVPPVMQQRVLPVMQRRQPQLLLPPRRVKAVWRKKEVGEEGSRKHGDPVHHNEGTKGTDASTMAPKQMNNYDEIHYDVGDDDMKRFGGHGCWYCEDSGHDLPCSRMVQYARVLLDQGNTFRR